MIRIIPGGGDRQDVTTDECPVIVADADCDTSKRPIVFVHGTFGSGDNIANVAMLFGSNGYCQDRFLAVEYNSLGGNPIADLDALIDKVLAETGADKVELAGHSQGTMHCGTYMSDPARAAKVAHYINYSGRTAPDGIPTLSISSNNENAGRSDSVVGLFMYDGNRNGMSELGSLFTAPFIVGTDVFMDATSPAWIELEWNDPTNGSGTTSMRIPNWPSSEALTLVYF